MPGAASQRGTMIDYNHVQNLILMQLLVVDYSCSIPPLRINSHNWISLRKIFLFCNSVNSVIPSPPRLTSVMQSEVLQLAILVTTTTSFQHPTSNHNPQRWLHSAKDYPLIIQHDFCLTDIHCTVSILSETRWIYCINIVKGALNCYILLVQ